MDDENELLEILAKLDEIMVENMLENRRLRQALQECRDALHGDDPSAGWAGIIARADKVLSKHLEPKP